MDPKVKVRKRFPAEAVRIEDHSLLIFNESYLQVG